MKIAILQPAYIPWIGFFHLLDSVDLFVILDDVQLTRRDWRTRNRIRTDQGWKWLSIPIKDSSKHKQMLITEARVENCTNWRKKHLTSCKHFYGKSPYFKEVYQLLEIPLHQRYEYLIDIDMAIISNVQEYLRIDKNKILFASQFRIPESLRKSERLIAIIKSIGVDKPHYVSGMAAKNYIESELFEKNNISLSWHNFDHPYYYQRMFGQKIFISHLSILDLLFNHGADSVEILRGIKKIQKDDQINVVAADQISESNVMRNNE